MSDTCYMCIHCAPADEQKFFDLGFRVSGRENGVTEMEDDEANYGHYGDLPTDIPWWGHHHEGGSYGSCEMACDGVTYADVECGYYGGYVIVWDDDINDFKLESVERIRRFHLLRNRAKERVAERAASRRVS